MNKVENRKSYRIKEQVEQKELEKTAVQVISRMKKAKEEEAENVIRIQVREIENTDYIDVENDYIDVELNFISSEIIDFSKLGCSH